jgi:hypothetical protein
MGKMRQTFKNNYLMEIVVMNVLPVKVMLMSQVLMVMMTMKNLLKLGVMMIKSNVFMMVV